MPIISKQHINEDALWGIWHITESSQELEDMLHLDKEELQLYSSFANETRRCHWLSYRALAGQLLQKESVRIRYDEIGKPYLAETEGHISVTHSGPYSAVIYSRDSKVGIDIERIQERIVRVSDKFLSNKELKFIHDAKRIQHMVTLWAAKEAVYKLNGSMAVDFRDHLAVQSFIPGQCGEFRCTLKHKGILKEYTLKYSLLEDYVLVWVKE